jgi:dipeptidyl aminopeptidase/acylaminoacyl peptidase
MTDLAARYAAAEALLPHQWKTLVDAGRVKPNWVGDSDRFWYRNTRAGTTEFVLVDPDAGTRAPAFDHERLAASLAALLDQSVSATALPFAAIDLRDGVVRFAVGTQQIDCDLDSYACTVVGDAPATTEVVSPDGRWAALVRDHNLFVRERSSGEERQLTTDGAADHAYAEGPDVTKMLVLLGSLGASPPPVVAWSPDSTRLLTQRTDQRELEWMHLVQSSPPDGSRPKLLSYRYAMVGDPNLATGELHVFDVATGASVKAPPILTPYMSPISIRQAFWSKAGDAVYFLDADRGEKHVHLRALDPATGEIRTLLEETSDQQVQTGAMMTALSARVLASGEVVWWSERSGWGHLYLYDTAGNARALTSGDWVVRDLVAVDEQARVAVVTAGGREPGVDPYVRGLYRVSLDGGDVEPIADDELDHDAVGSPSGRFLVDVASSLDTPGISTVRDTSGKVVAELERGDASRLLAAGYEPPERFTVKAADGVTDLYGVLFKPQGLDPSAKYPVLDDIYPGPQVGAAGVRFPRSGGFSPADHAASFTGLGFAVVVVDARGTPLRSKAFQEHSRGTREGDWVEDHVAALQQLAERHAWLDLDRVGIYGHSGGGYASTRAILRRPDFFKVTVAMAGDHDDHTYHAMWGEKYIGWADEVDYAGQSNSSLVESLEGKLFLIHGELDDNVTPHLTMRLVDALMKANKDFDLLIVPNAEHAGLEHQAYWLRKRWDYFVQHLQGETPPAYRIADIPIDLEFLQDLWG